MANSYVEYPTSGTGTNELGQKVFAIPFKYIAIADVEVKGYNGSTWTDLTIAATDNTAKTVELSAIPSTYQKIRVWRNSSTAQLVDFQNGSRLSETDLDTAYQQGLFVAQEVSENASTVTASGTSNVSLSGTTTVADLDVTGTSLFAEDIELVQAKNINFKHQAGGTLRAKISADSSDNLTLGTGSSGTTRMTINTDGNVGINGTPDSGRKLHIEGGDASVGITLKDTAGGQFGINSDSSSLIFKSDSAGVERFRLSNNGNLLLGTAYDGFNTRINVRFAGSGAETTGISVWTGGSSGVKFIQFVGSSGSEIGTIAQNGTSAVSYNTSSDYRLKENVTDVTDGITRVKQLAPKRFNFIADADTTVDGFLAHEAQAVVPESVTGTKDEVDDEGNPVMQGIDQAKLVPLLTAALQEAIAKIEVLETKVAALEA